MIYTARAQLLPFPIRFAVVVVYRIFSGADSISQRDPIGLPSNPLLKSVYTFRGREVFLSSKDIYDLYVNMSSQLRI